MFGLGAGELFVIFVLALIFIGPKKLPELAKGLGKGIKEFQKAKRDVLDEINDEPINDNVVATSDKIEVDNINNVSEISDSKKSLSQTNQENLTSKV